MALFIYASEISIPVTQPDQTEAITGVGALLTRDPIEPLVISDSLKLLTTQIMEEGKPVDKASERGFFLPMEDSDIARTHLLLTINDHVKGLFMVTFFDQPPSPTGRSERILFQFLNTIAARVIASEPTVNIQLLGPLDPEMDLKKFNEHLLGIILATQPNHAGEKTFYPLICLESGTQEQPGHQVLNLLLWAAANTRMPEPDRTWQDSIIFGANDFISDGEAITYHYSLNVPVDHFVRPYPFQIKTNLSIDNGILGLAIIERCYRHLKPAQFSLDNPYLAAPCLSIIKSLANAGKTLDNDLLAKMVSTFLGVFDNLPVYNEWSDSKDAWEDWLLAKEVAIRLGPGNPGAFEQLVEAYNGWRENILLHQYKEWCRLMRIAPGGA
ncbi:hypothetical protein HB364_13930 [Pseudoflavitalea sp. X16]|uniref:hypothetical protein n=1 Tax=Paraflavitalea devenefica TaxID=2716334 RepID=UPI00142497A9|nr:hypothetical protein [Paraflavitalea devenefica]NII26188.1 hypothetical protein [Paraflavitalea devenefica]